MTQMKKQQIKRIATNTGFAVGIVFILSAVLVVALPSVYQKGGVEFWVIPTICSYSWICALLLTMSAGRVGLIAKLAFSILWGAAAVFVSAMLTTQLFVTWRYGDKTWFLWNTPDRLVTNFVFFGTIVAMIFGGVKVLAYTQRSYLAKSNVDVQG